VCSVELLFISKCLFGVSFVLKGSAKLEKAEILQMTVDHLKMLHAAGGKGKNTFHLLKKHTHVIERICGMFWRFTWFSFY